jgi:hypothetical protein
MPRPCPPYPRTLSNAIGEALPIADLLMIEGPVPYSESSEMVVDQDDPRNYPKRLCSCDFLCFRGSFPAARSQEYTKRR